MLKNLVLYFFVLIVSCNLFAQIPLDTVKTEKGDVVLYNNNTWKYAIEQDFNGVLNEYLNSLLNSDSTVKYNRDWNNDVCFTSSGQTALLQNMKDTLWICVNDENDSNFCIPFDGQVTSRYGFRKGRYHNGIDIDLETGDTVRAAWSGIVRYARYNAGGFGNLVIIRHYNGLESFYAHLDQLLCAPNQEVKAGDVIGLGGNTGRSYGSHLHFEIRFYDAPINPEEVIDFDKQYFKDHNLLIHRGLFRPGAKPSDYNVVDEEHHTTAPKPVKKYYKVRTGDTLTKIAQKNNTTVDKICRLNGIRQTTTLQVGRNLRVK
jgi:murein DD-endopeptidase MepM/ murein hydrolase activator NlpD